MARALVVLATVAVAVVVTALVIKTGGLALGLLAKTKKAKALATKVAKSRKLSEATKRASAIPSFAGLYGITNATATSFASDSSVWSIVAAYFEGVTYGLFAGIGLIFPKASFLGRFGVAAGFNVVGRATSRLVARLFDSDRSLLNRDEWIAGLTWDLAVAALFAFFPTLSSDGCIDVYSEIMKIKLSSTRTHSC